MPTWKEHTFIVFIFGEPWNQGYSLCCIVMWVQSTIIAAFRYILYHSPQCLCLHTMVINLLLLVVCLLYFVPAGLYCVYNNLGFVNLQHFDPTTYFLLLQFRVVVTGVIFQVGVYVCVYAVYELSFHCG